MPSTTDDREPPVFSNRDEPIPVVEVTSPSTPHDEAPQDLFDDGRPSGKREQLKHALPTSKLKEKWDELGSSEWSSSVQDRLSTMLFQHILPGLDEPDESTPKDYRSRKYVDRPGFSLPLMSSNFRRFNSRIGIAFVLQNRLIRLFSWRQPSETLSFLAAYTFVCLDPALLPVLPLACCLFFLMVPAYLARHPPPPSSQPTELYSLAGPPVAPARRIKPAPELSKDFFRNMRDLQNSMEDFSRLHDATLRIVGPITNFSDEGLSSMVFLALFLLACALFIASHLLPWRAILLAAGWAATLAGHPAAQSALSAPRTRALARDQAHVARSVFAAAVRADIITRARQETRAVEVFELQHRALHVLDAAFEPFLFSPSPWAPLSPLRVAGDRPRGARFFEDVLPPPGWVWRDKKWTLDLDSREWVEDRCITAVEVEMDGERWVSDILYDDDGGGGSNDDYDGLAYGGDYAGPQSSRESRRARRSVHLKSWEEGSGAERKGEWRRRRWVREVERYVIKHTDDE